MKKTEEELDKLHEITMESLYEIFEDEMNSFFKFKEAALEILGYGNAFPFCTYYDDATIYIDKSLEAIEKNITEHILTQLQLILNERPKKSIDLNEDSEKLKKRFSEKIKEEMLNSGLI